MEAIQRFLRRSDTLHQRVQTFCKEPGDSSAFADIALDIARLQRDASPGFARLVAHQGGHLETLDEVPAVPSESFRLSRVAIHPQEFDEAAFVTSGTTVSLRGVHAFRRLDTYRSLAVAHAADTLFGGQSRALVVALSPKPVDPVTSSLSCMMEFFMQAFEATRSRWLWANDDIDLQGLIRARNEAAAQCLPLCLLGTSSAWATLLQGSVEDALPLPEGSRVMPTGGFKGNSAKMSHRALKAEVARFFRIPLSSVMGEYGMTELTSQLYENVTAPESEFFGYYREPPWLRVVPVDPLTQRPVPRGETGIARFIDLGNVDSAVAVLTQDLVRRTEHGVELMGRRRGAPLRGCSLATEALLSAGSAC